MVQTDNSFNRRQHLMATNLKKVTIENTTVFSDTIFRASEGEVFLFSAISYKSRINKIKSELNKKQSLYINDVGTCSFTGNYEIHRTDTPDGNSHAVFIRSDILNYDENTKEEELDLLVLDTSGARLNGSRTRAEEIPQKLLDKIHAKLVKNTPVPLLKEWIPYITQRLFASGNVSSYGSSIIQSNPARLYRIKIFVSELYAIIQRGFSLNSIGYESKGVSERLSDTVSLDKYLQNYGPYELKEGIESRFQPMFDSSKEDYSERTKVAFDYISYHGIDLYPAQKNIIEASARNLRKGNSLKIAEQGTGKTVMGVATVYSAMKNDKPTVNMVVCPGHLVEKWCDEINERFPLGKAVIVEDFKQFTRDILPMMNDKNRRGHLFLVISKNTAKSTYALRPQVRYSKIKKAYVCPHCGNKLQKRVTVKLSRGKTAHEYVDMQEADFLSYNKDTATCSNKVNVWNSVKHEYEEKVCGEHLWAPSNRRLKTKWIQLPFGEGWVYGPQLEFFESTCSVQLEAKNKERKFLKAAEKLRNDIEEGTYSEYGPRSYSIATFILKKWGKKLDYLIADELHEFKGDDTEQGVAFGRLCAASKHVLGMTGTLVNGYASSVFFILYRMFPGTMKAAGYDYKDVNRFIENFGVMKRENHIVENRSKKGRAKEMPGVSPHVFTKFLLNQAAFLRMDDISEGLPDYQEHPVSAVMDADVEEGYKQIEKSFTNLIGNMFEKGHSKMVGSYNALMSAYPDTSFHQPQIINPDSNNVHFTPDEVERFGLNDKEEKTLEIIQRARDNGEKVLIYTTWTNRTDANDRLIELLEERGLNASILKSNTVASRDRAKWIDKKIESGMDVMICNPELVKTGLDLLDFTTIIFYQIPYDLFTLRQASRRSLRLNQTRPVNVYFMYFEKTIQAQAVGLMASKQKASQAIEGNFTEEGLNAMSESEDMLSAIASNIVAGIEATVDESSFLSTATEGKVVEVRQVVKRGKVESSIPAYSIRVHGLGMPTKKSRKKPKLDELTQSTHSAMAYMFNNKLSVANFY